MKAVLAVALFLVGTNVGAEIYKQVDENGRVTYSNIPSKGAQKLNLEPLPTVPGFKPSATAPGNFPKVDAETQKNRDLKRRGILESELEQEKRKLEEARSALADAESVRLGGEHNYQKYLDRVKPYKDAVTEHERNIDALQQELAGLK